ncbi:MAG: hypothetical protein KAG70_10540 [Alcanivorax sp.]|nr:hypothetical protein [Alcanivorax sp.]
MTKGQLAQKILMLLGVNTRFSEASPEEQQDVLGYMEDWMLSNSAVGKRIGYNQADGTLDPDDEAGIPDWAVMGVTYSVAQIVAPYFDKPVHPSITQTAALGMQTIAARTIEAQPVQYPHRFPRGHAQGSPYAPKYYHPADRIRTNNDFLTDAGDEPITS